MRMRTWQQTITYDLLVTTPDSSPTKLPTKQLIASMLKGRDKVSDLIFSPGRAPQVEMKGELVELRFKGFESLTAEQVMAIAEDLMGGNPVPAQQLRDQGSADLSYALPGVARFRVNIFRQRSSYAVVMRVIPTDIPTLDDL